MQLPHEVDLKAGPRASHASLSLEDGRVQILNVTRNTQIANRAEVAGSGVKRSKGLLGRKGLERGEGMWIIPCEAVHTFFMQFPLDLIYLDKKNCIKKVRSNVRPWRLSACLSAHSILELPVGAIRDSQSQPGDIVKFEPPPQK